mgnify:FL=1
MRAVHTLTEMLNAESEMVRVAAANALLDRGYGKPGQALEVKGEQQLIFVVGRTLPKSYDPLDLPALPPAPDGEITDAEGILDITAEPPRPPQNGHRYSRNGSR